MSMLRIIPRDDDYDDDDDDDEEESRESHALSRDHTP